MLAHYLEMGGIGTSRLLEAYTEPRSKGIELDNDDLPGYCNAWDTDVFRDAARE